jgi:hypothetical protein
MCRFFPGGRSHHMLTPSPPRPAYTPLDSHSSTGSRRSRCHRFSAARHSFRTQCPIRLHRVCTPLRLRTHPIVRLSRKPAFRSCRNPLSRRVCNLRARCTLAPGRPPTARCNLGM